MQSDIKEMNADRESYIKLLQGVNYFSKMAAGGQLDKDSVNTYSQTFYSRVLLNPNVSRYEGLKASGKFDIIENKELLGEILKMYEEDLTFLRFLNNGLNEYKSDRLGIFLDRNLVYKKDGSANWDVIFKTPEMQNALRRATGVTEIINKYEEVIARCERIIAEINNELK